jgi:hypothetical protein
MIGFGGSAPVLPPFFTVDGLSCQKVNARVLSVKAELQEVMDELFDAIKRVADL